MACARLPERLVPGRAAGAPQRRSWRRRPPPPREPAPAPGRYTSGLLAPASAASGGGGYQPTRRQDDHRAQRRLGHARRVVGRGRGDQHECRPQADQRQRPGQQRRQHAVPLPVRGPARSTLPPCAIHTRPAASARFQNAGTQTHRADREAPPAVGTRRSRRSAAASGSVHSVGYTGKAVSTYSVVAAARPEAERAGRQRALEHIGSSARRASRRLRLDRLGTAGPLRRRSGSGSGGAPPAAGRAARRRVGRRRGS